MKNIAEIDYQNVEPYIVGKCKSFATKYNLDYGDLLGEAHLAFMEAHQRFNQNQGVKFITYFWSRLRGTLFDYLREEIKNKQKAEKLKYNTTLAYSPSFHLKVELEQMSDPAKKIVEWVTNNCLPGEKMNLTAIRAEFHKNRGWIRERVNDAIEEIRDVIQDR